ncbi:hypothetical protein EMIHUDRAFT_207806 [Emiliania huxleyi CCMP1516]|uniref:Uncharacterized protein n=2 Tax=Emiliania huxleyi TaxID=2903 RepID=A0A0D3JE11_EMIH1|nr:hypothetical protein EMIHUDRAFT_207806 [Emiliania huxleyi CCMP1516]EOD21746.1 hypothetical protein EMIHUDRAFT_207806 [Emiliania huxleyi CCMP1516]|eukprot:XP_005774175.1 hypothetical protein EMIHUDRAFT_207806 [Emiliania huxleyi CCMP1516]
MHYASALRAPEDKSLPPPPSAWLDTRPAARVAPALLNRALRPSADTDSRSLRLEVRSFFSQHCSKGFGECPHTARAKQGLSKDFELAGAVALLHARRGFATCLQGTRPFHVERFPDGSWIIGTAAEAPRQEEEPAALPRSDEEAATAGALSPESEAERKEQRKARRAAARQKRDQRMIFNQQGVAVVLSPSAHEAWLTAGEERHHDLGARVLALRLAVVDSLTGSRLGVFLVSAQAPSSKDPHTEEWDAFYAALATAISRKQPGDVLARRGAAVARLVAKYGDDARVELEPPEPSGPSLDLAATLDSQPTNFPPLPSAPTRCVGPFGIDYISPSGRRLLGFMDTHELASLATVYPKKHYATWIDPRSSNGHMNDHILISRVDLARFSDCGSRPCMLFESDHHLVGCKLRVTELGAGAGVHV